MVDNEFLKELNEEQRQMVLASDGPCLVVAGPGSGKTRALTSKIAYLIKIKGVFPDEVLAVTFTNKAANEMKERVIKLIKREGDVDVGYDGLGVNSAVGGNIGDAEGARNASAVINPILGTPNWIGTFHSVCAKILRIEAPRAILEPDFDGTLPKSNLGGSTSEVKDLLRGKDFPPQQANSGGYDWKFDKKFVIYDTDDSEKLIKEILEEFNINPKEMTPKSVLGAISKAKSEMVSPAVFRASAGGYFYERVAKIYPLYQQKLRENNALDFDDILYETVRLFENNQDLLESYQNRFQYILIDEYQDTNMVQYRLVKLLAAKKRNITVVGDVSQSIYSWRGANYRNMLQFEKDYPEAKIFHLAKNYRSTGNILKAAKVLIENNRTHIPIELHTDNGIGDPIKLYEAEQERAEANFVTNMISFLVGTVTGEGYELYPEEQYKNFAVLYRTNAQSRTIEEAFINAGIPYRIIGGVRFYDRREIKDALSYLKVFNNPKDKVAWARCINTPPRGIGKKTYEKITESKYDVELIESLTKVKWKKYIEGAQNGSISTLDLLDSVLKDFGYLEYLNDGTEESLSRIENLKELRTVAGQYPNLSDFLETVALVESSSKAENKNDNSVVLMTLHAAKGLEFETVFIVGMEEGLFPHSRSMTDPDELEEERRLCYVGITRAKQNLYMTYTRRRTYFGSTSSTIVSRFVAEIPEELIEFRFG